MSFMSRYAAIRFALYFLLVAGFFQAAVLQAKHVGPLTVFREGGFAETFQLLCALVTAISLLLLARKYKSHEGLLVCFSALALLASVRELNNTELYRVIFFFPGASWFFGLALLGYLIWRFRDGLPGQIQDFLGMPASFLFASGGIIITAWAQVFAQAPLFRTYEADRIVEEGLEAAGYLLILCGVEELSINLNPAGDQEPV